MRDARDYFVSKQGPYSKALYFGYLGPGTFKIRADIVALIGGQYGGQLEPHATIHKEVKIGHGKVIPLLLAKLDEKGRCAMDYLVVESQQPVIREV